jgi:hypothetical protein
MSLDPITAALDFGGKLLDKFIADPKQKDEAKLKLLEMTQNGELAVLAAETKLAEGQLNINAEEAKSSSLFVSGWRPFVGWSCGFALCYAAILDPILRFGAVVWFGYAGEFPEIDTNITMQVLLGMLGLAGMRSYEKKEGVASK